MIAVTDRGSAIRTRPIRRWADVSLVTRHSSRITRHSFYDDTNTYTWDARNRLVARAGPGVNATFQYDALGRRVSKTVNGQTTGYLYDGNDIVQEIGGSAVGASYVRSLNIDEPFVRQTSIGNEFYHVDALGSTLDLTSQAGAVQASYHYEAFGKTTITGTSTNSFQYTGRENDGTGLYFYRARYYSTASLRFPSEDPKYSPLFAVKKCRGKYVPTLSDLVEIDRSLVRLMSLRITNSLVNSITANVQKLHTYTYADNTPIRKLDPMGLIAAPQPEGCDRVGLVAAAFPCAFDCCKGHDSCYQRAKSWCDETSWTDPFNEFKRPDCWDCNKATIGCIAYNSINRKNECDLTGFPDF